jgi:integrase
VSTTGSEPRLLLRIEEAAERLGIGRSLMYELVLVEPVEPYTLEETRAILTTAQQGRNAARWAIALALGLRQGEVLGLKWADVDLDQGLLRIRSTRTRPRYEHGCSGDCGRAPGWCPKRRLINGETGSTKSDAGRRIVGLPPVLVQLLAEHKVHSRASASRRGRFGTKETGSSPPRRAAPWFRTPTITGGKLC